MGIKVKINIIQNGQLMESQLIVNNCYYFYVIFINMCYLCWSWNAPVHKVAQLKIVFLCCRTFV